MIKPFAYMYYRITVLYKKWGEKDAEIPATIIVSLFQAGNVLAILPFLINIRLNNWLMLAVYISLCLFNGFFSFSPMKQIKFCEKWKDEYKTKKIGRGVLIIIYMIMSILLYIIALDYYQGYNNWKWEF